jgi:hypothetical protein
MQMFLSIVLWILIGACSAYYAQIKGRDPITWFVVGMLLGLFSLIILYFLPPLEQKIEPAEPLEEIAASEPLSYQRDCRFRDWFYLDQTHNPKGPLSFYALRELWHSKNISPQTLVWSDGFSSWSKIEEVSDLNEML